MNKPLLSICIPTYNRAEYLKNSIESIICQDEFKNKQVEIVIADNASTDNTESVARPYAQRYENIFYYRNEKKECVKLLQSIFIFFCHIDIFGLMYYYH